MTKESGRKPWGLRAGEEWRGSNASQSHGCCFDAAILQQFVALGAEQTMQEFSAIQGELSNRFEVPSQPAPVIRVHAPKGQVEEEGGDWDEEERKSASRDLGPPVPGCA